MYSSLAVFPRALSEVGTLRNTLKVPGGDMGSFEKVSGLDGLETMTLARYVKLNL